MKQKKKSFETWIRIKKPKPKPKKQKKMIICQYQMYHIIPCTTMFIIVFRKIEKKNIFTLTLTGYHVFFSLSLTHFISFHFFLSIHFNLPGSHESNLIYWIFYFFIFFCLLASSPILIEIEILKNFSFFFLL